MVNTLEELQKEIEDAKVYIKETGNPDREWLETDSLVQWIHKLVLDLESEMKYRVATEGL
jgi:hypothetical protein